MKVKDIFFSISDFDFGLLCSLNQRDTSDEAWHAAESHSTVCQQKAPELLQHPMLFAQRQEKDNVCGNIQNMDNKMVA